MELIVDIGISQCRALLLNKEKPISIYTEDYSFKNISGNIYKGRVENITESLGCAFVNIGETKSGMLHFDDCKGKIKKGEEIMVQVTREPTGDKGARLSMNLSLPSKNSVLLVGSTDINISRKINDAKRRSDLFKLGKGLIKEEEGLGIIFRTQCEDLSDDDIKREFMYTLNIWKGIEKTWNYIRGEALLFDASSFINFIKREYINSSIEKIYINREIQQREIISFINDNSLSIKVSSVEEGVDKLNFLRGNIDYALNRKFDTEGGGNIVVDETEALTIIDVNSASFGGGRNLEEGLLNVNIKAAEKISQIISLRSSAGIILIDFINMNKESSRSQVQMEVERKFNDYNIKAKIHGFTQLGLLEISRAKKSRALRESVYQKDTQGKENPFYTIKNLENHILSIFYKNSKSKVKVNVSENIYKVISEIDFISSMKNIYSINVEVKMVKDLIGYCILENDESGFARISIDKRKVFGKVDEISEDDKSFSIKITKIN